MSGGVIVGVSRSESGLQSSPRWRRVDTMSSFQTMERSPTATVRSVLAKRLCQFRTPASTKHRYRKDEKGAWPLGMARTHTHGAKKTRAPSSCKPSTEHPYCPSLDMWEKQTGVSSWRTSCEQICEVSRQLVSRLQLISRVFSQHFPTLRPGLRFTHVVVHTVP